MADLPPLLDITVTEDWGFRALGPDKGVSLVKPYESVPGGNVRLFAVAQASDRFVAAGQAGLTSAKLSELRQQLVAKAESADDEDDAPVELSSKVVHELATTTQIIEITADEEHAIVASDASSVEVFTLSQLASPEPLNAVATYDLEAKVVDLKARPLHGDDLVVLTDDGALSLYSVSSSHVVPLALGVSCFSWSPKGKQLVVGLTDGQISVYSTTGSVLRTFQNSPPAIEDDAKIYPVNMKWLTPNTFLCVYKQESDDPEDHISHAYIVTYDKESKSYSWAKIDDPCPPFGDVSRETRWYCDALIDWDPNMPVLFTLASAPSPDISLLSPQQLLSMSEDRDRAALPFTDDDTSPVSLVIDVSSTEKVIEPTSGVDESGPLPILWTLNNEGTVSAWHIVWRYGLKHYQLSLDTVASHVTANVAAAKAAEKRTGSEQSAMPANDVPGISQTKPVTRSNGIIAEKQKPVKELAEQIDRKSTENLSLAPATATPVNAGSSMSDASNTASEKPAASTDKAEPIVAAPFGGTKPLNAFGNAGRSGFAGNNTLQGFTGPTASTSPFSGGSASASASSGFAAFANNSGAAGNSPFAALGTGNQSVFGSGSNTSAAGESPFASLRGGQSIFGGDSSSSPSGASPFASLNQEKSIFGGAASENKVSPNTNSSEKSIFGGNQEKSIFGGTQEKSIFGGTQEKSIFGGNQEKSIFGGNQEKSNFGGNQEKSIFGVDQNTSVFGANKDSSSSAGNQGSFFGVKQGSSTFGSAAPSESKNSGDFGGFNNSGFKLNTTFSGEPLGQATGTGSPPESSDSTAFGFGNVTFSDGPSEVPRQTAIETQDNSDDPDVESNIDDSSEITDDEEPSDLDASLGSERPREHYVESVESPGDYSDNSGDPGYDSGDYSDEGEFASHSFDDLRRQELISAGGQPEESIPEITSVSNSGSPPTLYSESRPTQDEGVHRSGGGLFGTTPSQQQLPTETTFGRQLTASASPADNQSTTPQTVVSPETTVKLEQSKPTVETQPVEDPYDGVLGEYLSFETASDKPRGSDFDDMYFETEGRFKILESNLQSISRYTEWEKAHTGEHDLSNIMHFSKWRLSDAKAVRTLADDLLKKVQDVRNDFDKMNSDVSEFKDNLARIDSSVSRIQESLSYRRGEISERSVKARCLPIGALELQRQIRQRRAKVEKSLADIEMSISILKAKLSKAGLTEGPSVEDIRQAIGKLSLAVSRNSLRVSELSDDMASLKIKLASPKKAPVSTEVTVSVADASFEDIDGAIAESVGDVTFLLQRSRRQFVKSVTNGIRSKPAQAVLKPNPVVNLEFHKVL